MTHQRIEQPSSTASPAARRSSCWVGLQRWLLWAGFAYLALTGWIRMGYAITNWYWLNFSGIQPGPLYQVITGGLWGLAGTGGLVWMILRRPWYRLVGLGAALFLALTYWIDRLLIDYHAVASGGMAAASNTAGGNAAFALFLTLAGLAYVALVLRPAGEIRALLHK